jgi:hypothetical protein
MRMGMEVTEAFAFKFRETLEALTFGHSRAGKHNARIWTISIQY